VILKGATDIASLRLHRVGEIAAAIADDYDQLAEQQERLVRRAPTAER
jgi:hypothetical protein